MRKTFTTNAEIMKKAAAEIAGDLFQIRRDASRTDEYKKAEIAKSYQRMRALRDRLVAERDAEQKTYRRTLEREIFAGNSADPSWAISRRDAADRVEQLESPAQASALLVRAERQRDEPLARAIAERSYEMGWSDVANQFIETHPDVGPRFEELWEHREPTIQQVLHDAIQLEAKPEELGTMSDWEIDRLASSFDAEQQAQAAEAKTQLDYSRQIAETIRISG